MTKNDTDAEKAEALAHKAASWMYSAFIAEDEKHYKEAKRLFLEGRESMREEWREELIAAARRGAELAIEHFNTFGFGGKPPILAVIEQFEKELSNG